jgi:cellobiose phosphorylase
MDLAPGEERQIVYIMGATERPAEIDRVVDRFSDPSEITAAFQALRDDWASYLSRFTVETPDADTNAMINFWNQVQCRTTLYWSRFVSGYETGLGRGMGTRDSGQDTLGTMHTVPDHARRMLTSIWRMQFADGHTWHQFFPLTMEGGPGLAAEYPQWPQWFSDDHLWLVISVCAYLRETGDFDYLEQKVPYEDHAEETVWEHMLRAVDFTLNHLGPHGLPRSGFSDWNDTLNIDHGSGKAESVWTGMQFCRAMLDLTELCEKVGRRAEAERFAGLHESMAAIINDEAWDGGWYMRSFDDDGLPIGVAGSEHHAIDLIPQSWSVIGDVAPTERAEKAMAAADEKLNTKFGLALIWPPYNGGDDRVCGISTFVPGSKENGGIFCHSNTWSIIAAAMLGHGDEAYKYYREILPLARTDSDTYKVEPYTYPQNICGPTHPSFGMARNAWLTGTAAWTFVAATQWILGIRPTFDGLRVAPTLPVVWPGYKAHREFRGTAYEISVRRDGPGNAVSMVVDGRPIEGDVVPLPAPGTARVNVEVVLT